MSGIGGGDVGTATNPNPFVPAETTTQPFFSTPPQTSANFPLASTPIPTSSPISIITISEIVTKTKPNHSLAAESTVTSKGTNTFTIADSEGRNHNDNTNTNNTISTAAIIFSIMVGFIIVVGCIALIFSRRKPTENKRRINHTRRNLYGEDGENVNNTNEQSERITVYSQINSISPPLNLPPPPPQRSPTLPLHRFPPPPPRHSPPPPRHSSPLPPRHSLPLPPIPQQPSTVLYRNPSNFNNSHDFTHLDPNYRYRKYPQLRSKSAYYNKAETNIDEPP